MRAYLNVNGYFTLVEYPVLEVNRNAPARSVTDLVVLASASAVPVTKSFAVMAIAPWVRGRSKPIPPSDVLSIGLT